LGTLADSATRDYYKFSGKAGQKLYIAAIAQGLADTNGEDPTVADTVVTLFDKDQKQLAENDDGWPRFGTDSHLFTVLPADGDYFVAVNECHGVFVSCGQDRVTTFDYALFVLTTDQVTEAAEGPEPNDTDMASAAVPYKVRTGGQAGEYLLSLIDGAFKDGADVDVFALNIPADTKVSPNQRPHADFWVEPITSQGGTGATANAKLFLVDSADLTKHVAEADQTSYSLDNPDSGLLDLSVPVQVGHQYYLFVQHAEGSSTPATDFYFISHFIGNFYYGDAEKSLDNDTAAAAEVLKTPAGARAGTFFVDGDISAAGTDVDYYTISVPTEAKAASLFCSAQRKGSGLRGATFSLLKKDDTPLGPNNVLTEAADKDLYLGDTKAVPIPAGTTEILLKVEAASQDPNVTGTYYRCVVGIH
jgi:hypothetical protein